MRVVRCGLSALPNREHWIAAAVLVLLVVLRSIVFVFWEQSFFDSDQAITGLMAKHLIESRAFPVFLLRSELHARCRGLPRRSRVRSRGCIGHDAEVAASGPQHRCRTPPPANSSSARSACARMSRSYRSCFLPCHPRPQRRRCSRPTAGTSPRLCTPCSSG